MDTRSGLGSPARDFFGAQATGVCTLRPTLCCRPRRAIRHERCPPLANFFPPLAAAAVGRMGPAGSCGRAAGLRRVGPIFARQRAPARLCRSARLAGPALCAGRAEQPALCRGRGVGAGVVAPPGRVAAVPSHPRHGGAVLWRPGAHGGGLGLVPLAARRRRSAVGPPGHGYSLCRPAGPGGGGAHQPQGGRGHPAGLAGGRAYCRAGMGPHGQPAALGRGAARHAWAYLFFTQRKPSDRAFEDSSAAC